MIIGLPGESKTDAVNTAKHISALGVMGIKIHSIYVMKGTRLAEMYRENLYTPPTLDEYADTAAECIGYIRSDMIVHRLTGDCPRDMLVAPDWNKNKNETIALIVERMKNKKITQGSLI